MIKNDIMNLKNRDLLLFSDEEMNPREIADRDEVLSAFCSLSNSIVTQILVAGDSYLEIADNHPVARQENTFPSSILHGFIIENLSKIPGIRLKKISKKSTIIEVGLYKVWVKKLDERGFPCVNETKSSVKRVYQKADGEDTMPVLILGYQLDQIERISRIQLIYIEGDRQIWAPIDLGDIAAAGLSVPIVAPAMAEPVVSVKPEKKRINIAS